MGYVSLVCLGEKQRAAARRGQDIAKQDIAKDEANNEIAALRTQSAAFDGAEDVLARVQTGEALDLTELEGAAYTLEVIVSWRQVPRDGRENGVSEISDAAAQILCAQIATLSEKIGQIESQNFLEKCKDWLRRQFSTEPISSYLPSPPNWGP